MKYPRLTAAALTLLTGILIVSGVLSYGAHNASERDRERAGRSATGVTVPVDYSRRVDRIVTRLQDEEYGLAYAPWNRLMMHGFLAASLGSIIRSYPEDRAFRAHAIEILEASYDAVNSPSIRSSFSASGMTVPYGIIYQAGRLKILEQLAGLVPEKYEGAFLTESDKIAEFLKKSPRLTAESYVGWGWYVDNADAYHALWSADRIRTARGQALKNTVLIASWTGELATHTGATGLPLAEAYRPGDTTDIENQVRGSATGWLLWDLYDIDPVLARKWFQTFKKEFFDMHGSYGFVRDVPRAEKKINDVFDGPKLGPYSSSATIL